MTARLAQWSFFEISASMFTSMSLIGRRRVQEYYSDDNSYPTPRVFEAIQPFQP